MASGGGMYEDLEESDHSNDSIIYRENILDKIDPEDDKDKLSSLPKSGLDITEFDNLNISDNLRDFFGNIEKYAPKDIELKTKWKIFIPELICGDLDAFLKVECKGLIDKDIGLTVLDEPSTHQSDPTIVELQQSALAKQSRAKSETSVKKINGHENFEKNIDKWIEDLAELSAAKP